MQTVNFRAVEERFGHIDATFVRATCTFGPEGGVAELVVRFYPWWEHPAYVDASSRAADWGFADYTAGQREVTVRAIRPVTAALSRQVDVTDWFFTDVHPLLWQFDSLSHLYINGTWRPAELTERIAQRRLAFVTTNDLARYLGPAGARGEPRALLLPHQLLAPVEEELASMGVPSFCPHRNEPKEKLIAFVVGGSDHIIAEDFELDVPEFIHEPHWFNPTKDAT
jgi:hypothetical protein